jgi:hypothetical protein
MGLHIRRAANADHESQIHGMISPDIILRRAKRVCIAKRIMAACGHDIITTEEKQAAAKQTFVF